MPCLQAAETALHMFLNSGQGERCWQHPPVTLRQVPLACYMRQSPLAMYISTVLSSGQGGDAHSIDLRQLFGTMFQTSSFDMVAGVRTHHPLSTSARCALGASPASGWHLAVQHAWPRSSAGHTL